MQRKPGYPAANCSIKMPDCSSMPESMVNDDEQEQQQRRLQLINFGHAQWGFNNWSWSVTKQDLDFVDFTNGKYCAGVVAFVSITVKSFDIHRENIGYATSVANTKGFAIYKSRKCAVTNALRETLLSFGGNVSTELCELLDGRDTVRESVPPANAQLENNQNVPNIPPIPTLPNMPAVANAPVNKPGEMSPLKRRDNPRPPMPVKNAPPPPPQPQPMPPHPAVRLPRPTPRPNSNEPPKSSLELNEEEARAERKRRQRQAQEEFRLKQLGKQQPGTDERHELSRNSSTFDKLLLDIPSQDIVIESTADDHGDAKRKSPAGDGGLAKRRGSCVSKLDIVPTDG